MMRCRLLALLSLCLGLQILLSHGVRRVVAFTKSATFIQATQPTTAPAPAKLESPAPAAPQPTNAPPTASYHRIAPATPPSSGVVRLEPGKEQVVPYPSGKGPQGSCSWTLSFRARCLHVPDPSVKQILARVGGQGQWAGAEVGYDGGSRRFFISAQDYKLLAANVVNCTKERLLSLGYEGTVLSLALDSETAMASRDVPLFLPPTSGVAVGQAAHHGTEWDIRDVDILVQPPKLEETDEEVALQVAKAKQHWAQERAKDPLEGAPRRHVIEAVCNKVEDAEERWMCCRRGRRMAERFEKWWYGRAVPVSRTESDTLVKHPVYEGGVRFSVVNGKVKSFEEYGGKGLKQYYNTIVPWVADLSRHNVFKEGQTFDFIMRYGDGCQVGWEESANLKGIEFTYPTAGYSHSSQACPFREPLDWLFFLQESEWLRPRGENVWEDLKNQSVWKGSLNNPYRVQLLDAAARIPEFQGSGGTYVFPQCIGWVKQPALRVKQSATKLCNRVPATPWDRQQNQKYHISIDGWGTTLRMLDLLRMPGVLFSVHNKGFVMGWEHDLVPWVHYIPLDPAHLQDSLLRRFQWAREHDGAAKEIAAEATRWYEKHGVKAPLYRVWELYAAFMADLWKEKGGGTVPVPPPLLRQPSSGSLTCDNVLSFVPRSKTAQKLQCGSNAVPNAKHGIHVHRPLLRGKQ